MSNIEKAIEVIRRWQKHHKTEMDNNPVWSAEAIAEELDYAGLLAPDLPRAWASNGKPAIGEWEYAVQYLTPDGWKYSRPSWDCRWQESEAVQEVRAHRDHPDEETRLVRRLASQPEVMEE